MKCYQLGNLGEWGYGSSLYCFYNFSLSLKIFQNDILKFSLLLMLVLFVFSFPYI